MPSIRSRRGRLAQLTVAFATGILGAVTLAVGSAAAFEIRTTSEVARPCGADAAWTASITASSSDYGFDWSVGYTTSTGATVPQGAQQRDIEPFVFDLGEFPADVPAVTVTLSATWSDSNGSVGSQRTIQLLRPDATECPRTTVTPLPPDVRYDCADGTIVITGADDTTTIDYTITTVTAPNGEGTPYQITITAQPRPGYEFPPDTTTEWTYTGTVDCDTTVTPTTPTVTYDCTDDTIVITGADDTTTIDYTITTVPAGEGETWTATITAAPRPGYEFPPDTTTEWVVTGTVDCLQTVVPAAPSIACANRALAVITPTAAGSTYTVEGDLGAVEGSPYRIVVTAVPAAGYEFAPAAQTVWVFTGTVDCVQVDQNPPATSTPPQTAPPSSVDPGTSSLPRTGAGSTIALLMIGAALLLGGTSILSTRRRTTHG